MSEVQRPRYHYVLWIQTTKGVPHRIALLADGHSNTPPYFNLIRNDESIAEFNTNHLIGWARSQAEETPDVARIH